MIVLSEYTLVSPEGNSRIEIDRLFISREDVCAIHADSADGAGLFLRGLATLEAPRRGIYRFSGSPLDFTGHQHLLHIKKRIAYIAPDTELISNRTVRENLLLMRYYNENSLSIDIDEQTMALCRDFGLIHKLDQRPGTLHPQERQTAFAIRELSKPFDLLLMNRPEDIISHERFDTFLAVVESIIERKKAVVFFSLNRHLNSVRVTRTISIREDTVTISPENELEHRARPPRIL